MMDPAQAIVAGRLDGYFEAAHARTILRYPGAFLPGFFASAPSGSTIGVSGSDAQPPGSVKPIGTMYRDQQAGACLCSFLHSAVSAIEG
jgi:hypothetical protein